MARELRELAVGHVWAREGDNLAGTSTPHRDAIAGITCTHLSSLSCEAISAINKTRSKIHTIFYWRAKIPLTYRSFCSVLLGSAVDFLFFDPTMILAERKPGLCCLLSRQIWEKVTDQGQVCFVAVHIVLGALDHQP